MTILVEMREITKCFPGVVANDCVNLRVHEGEVHALLGENGAGKSTLMNCLCGLYRPQDGEIVLGGQCVDISSTADAAALGIGMIHQHFMLVPQLTVVENVAASLRAQSIFLDLDTVREQILELAAQHDLQVDPNAYIWQLSVGAQQRVEIIRVLMAGADILILDEPTAVLTPQEVDELFSILDRLIEKGKTIIFITHKLDEVMAISDRVTVLRDGSCVDTVETSATTKEDLARKMVGREVLFRVKRESRERGENVLAVENLQARDSRDLPAVRGVSFDVHAGEILGIAGVDGNGQLELVEAITGLREATGGSVWLLGEDVTNQSPRHIRQRGLGHIPAERHAVGTVGEFSVANNLILCDWDEPPFSHFGWQDEAAVRAFAKRCIEDFDIRTPSPRTPAELLSGGNLQKVVLARELADAPPVLICAQATRGLDVGAVEYVHNRLLEERARGAGILLVSTELEEILTLSDRIAVMHEGEIMGVLENENVDLDELGLMMAGSRRISSSQRSEERVQ
jgi:simple sugar transport system ATP-binding protein